MKRIYVIVLVALFLGTGTGVARKAWRAHQNIVTLQVRNVPLAQILEALRSQTRETIEIDSRLTGNITLGVDDVPLREALDRIGEQVGALVTTVHAVHRSSDSIARLVTAMRAGDISQAQGWTHLAPHWSPSRHPREIRTSGSPPSQVDGEPPALVGRDEDHQDRVVPRRIVEEDVHSNGPGPVLRLKRFRGLPDEDDGEAVHEEVIMPERIVIETDLTNGVNVEPHWVPDRTTAQRVADQSRARCTTLYALHQSAAVTLGGNVTRHFRARDPKTAPSADSWDTPGQPPRQFNLDDAEREARRAQLSRYQNLTPEQRAERARAAQNFPAHP